MSASKARTSFQMLIDLHLHLRQQVKVQTALDLSRSHLTFHPFPRLPTELRLHIWQIATTLTPRIHEICVATASKNNRFITPNTSQHPLNGMALATHESASVYKLAVSRFLHISEVNYEIDTIFLSPWLDTYYNLHNNLRRLSASRCAGIQRFAIYTSEIHSRSTTGISIYTSEEEERFAWLDYFPALKTLVLVCTTRNRIYVTDEKGKKDVVVKHAGMPGFVGVGEVLGAGGEMPMDLDLGVRGAMKDGRTVFWGLRKAREFEVDLKGWREERGKSRLGVEIVFLERAGRVIDGIEDEMFEEGMRDRENL